MERMMFDRKRSVSGTGCTRRYGWRLLARVSLWCVLLGHGLAAHALGLGQASVQSYLNQPLDARIDLISRSEAEMATVTAALASPADFQIMGLTRTDISAPLEFTVNRDLADPHIRVTSDLPMGEPVVQLVVEVVWSSGRMLRQYTLFLDPPTFTAPAPLPSTSTRAPAAPQPAAPSPALASQPPAAEAVPEPATTSMRCST